MSVHRFVATSGGRALTGALALLLSACGFGGANSGLPECDDGRLAEVKWAVEVTPSVSSGYVPQEFVDVQFGQCATTLELETPHTISGKVVGAGAPVNARVVASRESAIPGRPRVVRQAQTNSSGEFSLKLSAGTYELRVLPSGSIAEKEWPPMSATLTVADGMEPLELQLSRGLLPISGIVLSALGSGLEGVRVRVADPSTGDLISSVATTDLLGVFTIWLPADFDPKLLATLHLVADGGPSKVTLSLDVPIVSLPLPTLELLAPPLPDPESFTLLVNGHSTSGATVPVQGARVDFSCTITDALIGTTGATFQMSASTDQEGRAVAMLLPGTTANLVYNVTVTPPPDSQFARTAFSISAGQKGGVLGTVSLDPRPSVIGQVLSSEGSAVRGLVVSPQPAVAASTGGTGDAAAALPEAVTASDGRFILRLEQGTYDLDFIPPPTQSLPRWTITSLPMQGDVDLGLVALPSPIPTELQLVGPRGEPVSGVSLRLYALQSDGSCLGADGAPCPAVPRVRGEGTTSEKGRLPLMVGTSR